MNVPFAHLISVLANVDQTAPLPDSGLWMNHLSRALAGTAAFGILGILLMLLGFKAFEWITGRLDVEKELAERNYAVAIVVAAIMLSLSWIIVHSMS